MAVPLSPLSVTATSRGAALGAGREETKDKNHTFMYQTFSPPPPPPVSLLVLFLSNAFFSVPLRGMRGSEEDKRLMIAIRAARQFIS